MSGTTSWPHDMEGYAKTCVERYCELSNQRIEQLHKVSTPCLGDHQFSKVEQEKVGELSKVCSQLILNCLYLARVGRPHILWSVNHFARGITKWNKADEKMARLIFYIHCASVYCFKMLFLRATWQIQKSTSGGVLRIFGSHTIVPLWWSCKKQTAGSHSSTEAEFISLHAGLRRDEFQR